MIGGKVVAKRNAPVVMMMAYVEPLPLNISAVYTESIVGMGGNILLCNKPTVFNKWLI